MGGSWGAVCPGCGRGLDPGARFCDACGRPVDVRPAGEPATGVLPPVPGGPAAADPLWEAGPGPGGPPPQRGPRALLIALPLALLLVAALVVGLVVLAPWSGDDAASTAPATSPAAPGSTAGTATSSSAAATSTPVRTGDLTSLAVATAPVTSPDNVDDAGNRTSYAAAQMLDGDPTTTWRMDGDGTGVTLTFTLDAPRSITQLGLVNGYAKTDPVSGVDRYSQGRRITRVTWTVGQQDYGVQLRDGDRGVQTITVPGVRTRTVTLTVDAVTAPGDPQFDRTAISDVLIAGG